MGHALYAQTALGLVVLKKLGLPNLFNTERCLNFDAQKIIAIADNAQTILCLNIKYR